MKTKGALKPSMRISITDISEHYGGTTLDTGRSAPDGLTLPAACSNKALCTSAICPGRNVHIRIQVVVPRFNFRESGPESLQP